MTQPVGTLPFTLPNGSPVNLTANLKSMLETAATYYSNFRPYTSSDLEECDSHLELHANMTTLDLNVLEAGISFGYTPEGSSSPITGVTGNLDVKVGTIAMDFSVWECVGSRCMERAAVSVDHRLKGVTLKFKIDFNTVTTSPSLVYNTALGDSLQKMMNEGMRRLGSSSWVNELPWRAHVREYDPNDRLVYFDAGSEDRVGVNQSFAVYSVAPAQDACSVYRVAAYIRTIQVDQVSSIAIVEAMSPRAAPISEGDVVMIRVVR